MNTKFQVKRNKSGYEYIEVGTVEYFNPHYRIWVNNRLIEKDDNGEEFVRLAGVGRELVVTEKQNYVLRPSEEVNTFVVGRACGYRGNSNYKVKKGEIITELSLNDFQSQRGNLGVSTYGIISTKDKEVVVDEFADGRLYGDDKVYHKRYFINEVGDIENEDVPDCVDDESLCDILKGLYDPF